MNCLFGVWVPCFRSSAALTAVVMSAHSPSLCDRSHCCFVVVVVVVVVVVAVAFFWSAKHTVVGLLFK